ncbi:hypothetical protein ACAW74_17865 [Fibrella sp. WM1]|uniref:hypothetical protein n=1 Tax=Fibrella musci TaxID=3242485 RepID=UPI003521EFAB
MQETSVPQPDTDVPTDTTLTSDEQAKLRELTAQSWNLELAISGVAMYAILLLPDLIASAYSFILYNYQTHAEGLLAMLPTMAYSLLKVMCYVLFGAFLVNFIMRAFWVGMVGLQAVYPAGIRYDNLPFMSEQARRELSKQLGPLDRYILKLDKKCNIVFANAFFMVFIMAMTMVFFLFMLFLLLYVQPNVPSPVWLGIKIIGVLLVIALYTVIALLSVKKIKESSFGYQVSKKMSGLGKFMYLGFYVPMSFLANTISSNQQPGERMRGMAVFMGIFFVIFFTEYTADLKAIEKRSQYLNDRHLFSARVDSLYADANAYDNLRPDGEYVDAASIQAKVVREPYLTVSVAYPKALDTLLTRLATEPKWSDTLSREVRRKQYANWSNQQINALVCFRVNDSLCANTGLVFVKLGSQEQHGLQTVLIPGNLQTGRNTLQVGVFDPKHNTTETIATIPFWYVPESQRAVYVEENRTVGAGQQRNSVDLEKAARAALTAQKGRLQ